MPGADDARLALAEDEVLKVNVGGDLVAGGDQTQLTDDHARLQKYRMNTKDEGSEGWPVDGRRRH